MFRSSFLSASLILILISVSFLGFSQNLTTKNEIVAKVDSVMAGAIENKAFPGAVIWIGTKDSILYHQSYGYHTYDSMVKAQKYHLYDLASVTKVSAATLALMKLYDDGDIILDDPIRKYITGFRLNKRGRATLRSTLAHQAGWRPWIPYYQDMLKGTEYKSRFFSDSYSKRYPIQIKDSLFLTKNNYQYIKKQIKRSDFDPDRGYAYSGLFFYMVPELVQTISGLTFEQYLGTHFYDSLRVGLTFNPLDKYSDSLIVPTEIDTFFRQGLIHGRVHDEGAVLMGGVSGNAGLFGTAADVGRLWQFFLNQGQYGSKQYLSPQTIELFTVAQYPNQGNRRGLGFDKPLIKYDSIKSSVSHKASNRSFGHSGYTGPLVWADPEKDLVFVILCNRVYPNRLQRSIYELNIRPVLQDLAYDLRESIE